MDIIVGDERLKMDGRDTWRSLRRTSQKASLPVTAKTFELITSQIESWNLTATITESISDYESLTLKVVDRTGCGVF
jgi:hypothetical protein